MQQYCKANVPCVFTLSSTITVYLFMKEKIELTSRQKQIVSLVAKGYSRKQIAAALDVTLETIHSHFKTLHDKLGVHTNSELIIYAIENGYKTKG